MEDNPSPCMNPPPAAEAPPPYEPLILPMYPVPPPPRRGAGRADLLLMLLSGVAGFFGGAALVGFLWFATGRAGTVETPRPSSPPGAPNGSQVSGAPDARNSPQALLAEKRPPVEGLTFTIPVTRTLTAADLAFGEKQVARMVKDRPEMVRYVQKGDPVWMYCARAFAGQAIGQRVYWDSTLPDAEGVDAQHFAPEGAAPGYIRVRLVHNRGYEKDVPLTCEDLWACAVYELENIRGSQAFDTLYKRACRGELSRAQWIYENTHVEYLADLRTAKLYETLWLPMAEARGIPSTGAEWYIDMPKTFEAMLSLYDDPNDWPWNFWGKYWDEEIEPYLKSRQGL